VVGVGQCWRVQSCERAVGVFPSCALDSAFSAAGIVNQVGCIIPSGAAALVHEGGHVATSLAFGETGRKVDFHGILLAITHRAVSRQA
jgi:hypothetical protein